MSAFKTYYTIFDVTANLLISREVVAFSCQILDKGGLFRILLWFLWQKWRDLLRRERGGVAEKSGLVLGISRCRPKHKKENHTLSEDLCGFLACYPKIVFPSFELCVFFFVLCIRCYPKLSLKFGIIFEKPFRDLHRIEGSSLFDLVAHQPEGEAIGVGQVFADAAHKDVVATFKQERHRIFAH